MGRVRAIQSAAVEGARTARETDEPRPITEGFGRPEDLHQDDAAAHLVKVRKQARAGRAAFLRARGCCAAAAAPLGGSAARWSIAACCLASRNWPMRCAIICSWRACIETVSASSRAAARAPDREAGAAEALRSPELAGACGWGGRRMGCGRGRSSCGATRGCAVRTGAASRRASAAGLSGRHTACAASPPADPRPDGLAAQLALFGPALLLDLANQTGNDNDDDDDDCRFRPSETLSPRGGQPGSSAAPGNARPGARVSIRYSCLLSWFPHRRSTGAYRYRP